MPPALLAKGLDDQKLVLGKYLGEAVRSHDLGAKRRSEVSGDDTVFPKRRQPFAI